MSSPDQLDEALAALRPAVPRNFALRVEAAVARAAAARRRRRVIAAGAMSLALAASVAMVLRATPVAAPVARPSRWEQVASPSTWRTTLAGRDTVSVAWARVVGLDPHTVAVLTVSESAPGTAAGRDAQPVSRPATVYLEEPSMFSAKGAIALAVATGTVLTVHVVRGRAAVHTDDDGPGLVLASGDRAAAPAAGGTTVTRGREATAVARTAPPPRASAPAAQPATGEVAVAAECEPTAPDEPCDCADGNCEKSKGPELPTHVELELDGAPVMGAKHAKVTLVQLTDYQCPFCEKSLSTIHELAGLYPDDLRVVIKNMPLPGHKQARPAAIAALAAHRQGKFWEMHEMLFSNQDRLDPASIVGYARHLKLDVARFQADLADPAIAAQVDADFDEAVTKGFQGVPAFTINGRVVVGALPLEQLKAIVDEELARLK